MTTKNKSALAFGVVLTALLFLAGCVASDIAVLTESDQVKVPDLSGSYSATEDLADKVVVIRKQNNVFSVKQDDGPEEEGILVPLNAPDAYLLQLKDGEDAGYVLLPLQVKDGEIIISMLAPASQEGTNEAFEALQKKYGVEIRDDSLINTPPQKAVIDFFSACFREPDFLATLDTLIKE